MDIITNFIKKMKSIPKTTFYFGQLYNNLKILIQYI